MAEQNILIQNGTLFREGKAVQEDILIKDGLIAAIGSSLSSDDVQIIPAQGKLVSYGLADVHVHFREPGYSYKETIASGSRAAARGGYTTVCTMPNLNPVPDTVATISVEKDIIDKDAVIEVRPYASITLKRQGRQLVDFPQLLPYAVGFSDDGSGVQTDAVMKEAMQKVAATDSIIAAHCEDNSLLLGGYIHKGAYAAAHGHKGICSESEWKQIARDIQLAEETGCHYHVCHISTKESVALIREAKQKGIHITCETAPHYLTLCDNDLQEDGRFKMNPPLRSEADKAALIEGVLDGTIDCIATDHAPHSAEEKSRGLEKSAMGITGLETAFPVVYTHLVRTGILSLDKMMSLMCTNPRNIFRLGGRLATGEPADIAIFDLDTPYRINSQTFLSQGHSTPFDGWEVYGKCIQTIYHGQTVWKEK